MSVCLAVSSGGDEYHLRLQPSPLCTKYTSTCTTSLHKDHSPCGPLPCHRKIIRESLRSSKPYRVVIAGWQYAPVAEPKVAHTASLEEKGTLP